MPELAYSPDSGYARGMSAPDREDIRIPSHGEQLAAYYYQPTAHAKVPCVVMAHGFTGTRDDGLPPYAEAFRDAGFAVVVFDYRHFGASTGEPRQLLDIGCQHDDYRAAVAWARRQDGIDPERIVLWGSSFSGGHVLAVAAGDPRIAAVISQAPFTDAIPTLRQVPPATIARLAVAGLRDQAGAWLGRPPGLVPAVGDPGTAAAITAPGAKSGFEVIIGPESLWRNELAARLMLRLPLYRPVHEASRLTMPLLVCVCDDDTITPPGPSVEAARKAPRGELLRYPYEHFDIYTDPRVKTDQVAFLRRVLGPQLSDGTA